MTEKSVCNEFACGKRRECEWAMVDECRGGPMAPRFPSFTT